MTVVVVVVVVVVTSLAAAAAVWSRRLPRRLSRRGGLPSARCRCARSGSSTGGGSRRRARSRPSGRGCKTGSARRATRRQRRQRTLPRRNAPCGRPSTCATPRPPPSGSPWAARCTCPSAGASWAPGPPCWCCPRPGPPIAAAGAAGRGQNHRRRRGRGGVSQRAAHAYHPRRLRGLPPGRAARGHRRRRARRPGLVGARGTDEALLALACNLAPASELRSPFRGAGFGRFC